MLSQGDDRESHEPASDLDVDHWETEDFEEPRWSGETEEEDEEWEEEEDWDEEEDERSEASGEWIEEWDK